MTNKELKELEANARDAIESNATFAYRQSCVYAMNRLANPTAILSLLARLKECEQALDYDGFPQHLSPSEYFDKWGRE